MTTDEDLWNNLNHSGLATSSKEMYRKRINMMLNIWDDVNLTTILLNPQTYAPRVKRIWGNSATAMKNIVSTLLAVFKYNPEFRAEHQDKYDEWYKTFNVAHTEVVKHIKKNEPTERQKDGYVAYKDFKDLFRKLPEGSKQRLAMAMYSLIPPVRNDYHRVKIYHKRVPKNPERNYLLIQSANKMKLMLTDYKTHKTMGQIEYELPAELVKEIQMSLKKNQREWLFSDVNDDPYRDNAFLKYIHRLFEKETGKPLTISILRHSFINSLDFNELSIEQREAIGRLMGHSVAQAQNYKWVDRSDEIIRDDAKGDDAQ